jgi:hypothetical protein
MSFGQTVLGQKTWSQNLIGSAEAITYNVIHKNWAGIHSVIHKTWAGIHNDSYELLTILITTVISSYLDWLFIDKVTPSMHDCNIVKKS